MLSQVEDTREPKYITTQADLVVWCECCENPLYEGDTVLRDNRFKETRAYICLNCCEKENITPKIAEIFGATYEEVF